MAFIPGVSYGSKLEDSHAFIQVIDATRNRSDYFTFPLSDFKYAEDRLEIYFGNNSFSTKGLALSLKNSIIIFQTCYMRTLIGRKSVELTFEI